MTATWLETNQRNLMAELAEVRSILERYIDHSRNNQTYEPEDETTGRVRGDQAGKGEASALDTLCTVFNLSPFERMVLLLCAGIELDGSFLSLCARAHGDGTKLYPTFSLALAALPGAHWSAMVPTAPLRHWRLIEMMASGSLTTSPLRIDEKVLHYLAGVLYLDTRLTGIIEPVACSYDPVPSHQRLVEEIGRTWSEVRGTTSSPVVQLCGREAADIRDIAAKACTNIGLSLNLLPVGSLPAAPDDLETFMRLWEREAALTAGALLVEFHDRDTEGPARLNTIKMIERLRSPVIVSSRERLPGLYRRVVTLDVHNPTHAEQNALWQGRRGITDSKKARSSLLASQFDLSARAIHQICDASLPQVASGNDIDGRLWDACRVHTRPSLEHLARRINPVAGWDDLVLPELQQRILRNITLHVRHRAQVYEAWGFAGTSSRGLGISALFEGSSGTGKTMAAEVLARDLRLDLYCIDLSQVVSKYIGETEKNLRQVFDAAEPGGAILLFDEADALFGKRSEVKDSHDRYANMEVSYLLQRIEAYRGLAILTTNMKSGLDPAFLRRLRFVVQFPFPDASCRAEIWKRVFPPETPTSRLDIDRLARLNIPGGNIRNIAMNAAFLAAGDGGKVCMSHILEAARTEYAKLEKSLSAGEIAGWA